MDSVRFRLDLSPEQILAYYQGAARQVLVRARDGRRVQFPAEWLRRFISPGGVQGEFQLSFDDQHRLLELRRLGD